MKATAALSMAAALVLSGTTVFAQQAAPPAPPPPAAPPGAAYGPAPYGPYDQSGPAYATPPPAQPTQAGVQVAPPAYPQSVAPQPLPPAEAEGRWVYTPTYGWLWIPSDMAPVTYGGVPYVYLYTPTYGWTWYVSPWGPGPYRNGDWTRHPWHPRGVTSFVAPPAVTVHLEPARRAWAGSHARAYARPVQVRQRGEHQQTRTAAPPRAHEQQRRAPREAQPRRGEERER